MRRQKTDADFAASQHLFRTDNFTGNWTKANSWGFMLLFTGRLRVSLPAVKEHQPVMRRSFSSDNNRGKFREVDANLLEAHLSPALILDGICEPWLHALVSLHLYFAVAA